MSDAAPMDQGRRAKEGAGPLMDTDTPKLIGGDSFVQRTKNPEWLKVREEVYAKIKAAREAELSKKTPVDITVTMPDGNVLSANKEGQNFQAWKTTPYEVAATISQGLADASTVARVTYEKYAYDYSPAEDGMEGEDTLADAMEDLQIDDNQESASSALKPILWDMMRPLVGPVAKLEFLKFDSDQDAKTVFWHSSAHMMGEALEHLYGCKLTIGPPLKGGFYYDSYMGKESLKEEDCKYEYENMEMLVIFLISSQCYVFRVVVFQTNPCSKKSAKLSNKSKSSNVWLSPRRKHSSCLPTIHSRWRF